MSNSADAIAAFLAKGGKVSKVATGANSGISDRAFYLASRGEISLKPPSDNELIERRYVRGEVVYNGLGEVIGRV